MLSAHDQQPITPTRPRRRGGLAAAVVAVVLGLAGLGTLGYAASHQYHAPQPPAVATVGPLTPGPSAAPASPPSAASATPKPPGVAALPASAPTAIRIPAINVDSVVNKVGLNRDHTMEVPREGPLYDQAAWYRYSPTPGQLGPAVIIGHIDSARDGPSVFFKLGALKPGQRIEVDRADGAALSFEVDTVASYPKDSFPVDTVYGDTTYPGLRLITCGGRFDTRTGQYLNNTVVFAHLMSDRP